MSDTTMDRRGLFGAGAMAAGVGLLGSAAPVRAASPSGWAPALEAQDAWMEVANHRHRMLFDTTTATAGMEGASYANTFMHMNEASYGLSPAQVGVILVLRHGSTPFGYNDAIWKKHGTTFAKFLELKDKNLERAKTGNPMLAPRTGSPPKGMEWGFGPPLKLLADKGAMFAVCGVATAGIAQELAGKTGDAAAIEAELKANLIPNAHIVPAGIVAVNRAQERGYALAFTA